jgi:hypothetical protein
LILLLPLDKVRLRSTGVAEEVPGLSISIDNSPKLLFAGILMLAGKAE